MVTCTACGSDVTGKKFCQQCGTPVQAASATGQNTQTTTCPSCHQVVAADNAFCVHCGHNLRAPASTPQAAAPVFCNACGKQNAPGMRFCGGCGSQLSSSPVQTSYTPTPSDPYSHPQYTQPQYQQTQYQQTPYNQYNQQSYGQPGQPTYLQNPQYGQGQPYQQPQPYGQPQYAQGGYQPQPMMGQQPMVLRCPICQAMAPMGTSNCASCRTSLAGVVPTPANTQPGQQGGVGGFLQGSGGQMAMGALGGAAAVIGGEMLLHGLENRFEGDRGYGYENRGEHRDEGLLGGLGEIANDIGLF